MLKIQERFAWPVISRRVDASVCSRAARRLAAKFLVMLLFYIAVVSHPVQAAESAQSLVQHVSRKVIGVLEEKQEEIKRRPAMLYQLVEQHVVPYFDFVRMSRLVLGKYWRRATRQERIQFVEEFHRLLVRTYAGSMSKYSGEKIVFLPFRGAPKAVDVNVRTLVELQNTSEVTVDYRLHLNKGVWKIYDVAIGGVSLVVNYRSSFSTEIRRLGGVAGLIKKLHEHNRQVRNG